MVRIVERTFPTGKLEYVIQTKRWFGAWLDASFDVIGGWDYDVKDSFPTLIEAKENLKHFGNPIINEKVVYVQ